MTRLTDALDTELIEWMRRDLHFLDGLSYALDGPARAAWECKRQNMYSLIKEIDQRLIQTVEEKEEIDDQERADQIALENEQL